METPTFWHKQTAQSPLFTNLIWSRPENKLFAGKLLIIGGNLHGFTGVAEAYQASQKAGIGTCRVLLPDALRKTLKDLPEMEFVPSTPSGSFAQQSLAELLAAAEWADGVLLAGDFGHNSETAVLLEKLAAKYDGELILTKDAIDNLMSTPDSLVERGHTTLIIDLQQLQKLAIQAKFELAFTSDMDLLRLVDTLHEFSLKFPVAIVTQHLDNIVVASAGEVSTTRLSPDLPVWPTSVAAHAAVWQLQNPGKTFEALSSALVA